MAATMAQTGRYTQLGPVRRFALAAWALSLLPVPISASDAKPAVSLASTAHPAEWPELQSPISKDPALEARIAALLASMTLEEKVGQVVQGDLGSVTPQDVRKYRLGSVLAGGNSDPGGRYDAPASEWLALADAFYHASMDTREGGKPIPVLLGIDAVHGHNNVVGATLFPHNIALGATDDVDLLREIARATAIELRTTGFEWTFAPTVTVPRDDRWGRTYEGYSESPGLVARYATAVVEGLQGHAGSAEFLDARHVVASSKHFIGDGGTTGGKDKGDTAVTEVELRDVHGAGHIAALRAGTQTVMASFSSWNGTKMHGHRGLLTDVLKGRLGFDGFVVGDWNGHGEVPGCSNESCAAAFLAGVDMFMAPDTWKAVYANTVAQVRAGQIPMARLDDAVTRILRVKFRLGLFEAGAPSQRPLGGKFEHLGSTRHRRLARTAVRQSLVLLKNNGGLLPLNPRARVLVAGDGADDIGKQSGGWTLSWQGTGNKPSDFPEAESVWSGIKAAVEAAGGKAVLATKGDYESRPDVAIVVFGEQPYAEFIGDVPNLAYQPGKETDLDLLRRLKAAGIPVVSIFLSGRPLWVNREINASDAFVAAWLPGSEGGGIADVLFKTARGETRHDFVGKLPYSWPKSAVQTPLNVGQADYDPQFPFGYGLTYRDIGDLPQLPESSGLRPAEEEPDVYFARGMLAAGWTWMLADADADADSAPGKPVAALPSSSASKRVSISSTDHQAQEDARRLRWTGAGAARVWLHREAPIDLSSRRHADVFLVATIRLGARPRGPVSLGIGCGEGCSGQVAAEELLQSVPTGQWRRVGVPLRCFVLAGADLSRVTEMLHLRSEQRLDLSVSRVALGEQYDHLLACPAR